MLTCIESKSYLCIDRTQLLKDEDSSDLLNLGFCKSTLGVKKSSTKLAVRAELGRLPL
jgi:hypothetical protein